MTRKKTKTPKTVKFALWLLSGELKKMTRGDQLALQIATISDRDTIEALSGQMKCAELYKRTGKVRQARKSFERSRRGKYAAG